MQPLGGGEYHATKTERTFHTSMVSRFKVVPAYSCIHIRTLEIDVILELKTRQSEKLHDHEKIHLQRNLNKTIKR